MRYRSVALLAVLALLITSLPGCEGKKEVIAPLHGKVTYRGKPVKMGRVNFSNPQQGIHLTANITESGGYEVRTYRGAGIPPGTYQVTVLPPAENPDDEFAPPPACRDIPAKYRNPATSGLAFTVAQGRDNQYDINMTDH
jgi:hypothetical protein